ncbi:hypothetical protein BGHDH14_bgh06159 [Blumeria hordei DH14]|uniref:Uncharacterized protein n=1 Tax=Blumeria graminis f. sp. hordei (strain DH14) TaxID=546991 RepID=N1JHG4_BLUG1|nr:hypothetical protein BGHDH14_bgh06159 [Blumeria hordei DH14]
MASIWNVQSSRAYLVPRAADSTTSTSPDSTCGPHPCEKPTSSSTFTLPIILGVAVPLVGAAILFIILQRRHTKKMREEDANDRHASLDFGLGDVTTTGRQKGGRSPGSSNGEKSGLSHRQLSMDISMGNPFLVSPELKGSRESLQSLSKSMRKEDPYRPVSEFIAADAAANLKLSKLRPSPPIDSGMAPAKLQEKIEIEPESSQISDKSRHNALAPSISRNSTKSSNGTNFNQQDDDIRLNYPAEPPQAHFSSNYSAPPESWQNTTNYPSDAVEPQYYPATDNYDENLHNSGTQATQRTDQYDGTVTDDFNYYPQNSEWDNQTNVPAVSMPSTSVDQASNFASTQNVNQYEFQSNNNVYAQQTGMKGSSYDQFYGEEMISNNQSTQDVSANQYYDNRLGAQEIQPSRQSTRLRPLPPNAVTETDDPEIRANRIRSFYKEYFDESIPAPVNQYEGEYYNENYYDETAYYDPDTNQFVMPYAQPVTRRAMTPPAGYRPGPVRTSSGVMSGENGGYFPQGYSGPRPHSSASGRKGVNFRKPALPPAELNVMPNPSKLRDDSFAINPMDFAPPPTFRDRAAGRTESFQGNIQAFSPVINSSQELAPMPSPHMLRKSGAFSALDFAPPKKFWDGENGSDAGSIRSSRSGRSHNPSEAARHGNHQVDTLPDNVFFTKDAISSSLKPQWDMSR